jgi:dihydroneopterin aldolase
MRERSLFIRNWVTHAFVGIYQQEYGRKRRLRLNITFYQQDEPPFRSQKVEDVVDYGAHKQRLETLLKARHYPLIEELAECLAESSFADPLLTRIRVEIEKMDLYKGVESCGVVIERQRGDYIK